MGKIFCLMGKSSSGKDTIFKRLQVSEGLNLKPIISYTTRPMRYNELDGVEYHFITEKILSEYEKQGKIIEQRVYHTVYGDWYYCTVDDGQINLAQNNYLVIVTLEAYNNLKRYFGEEYVKPIYIDLDDGTRLERALQRERNQVEPNYNEMCRRFLADSVDFSEDNLNMSKIDKKYNNLNLEECINIIKEDILKFK